jgi:hypothetical protein
MLAASRSKTIRETEEIFLINLVEDGNHRVPDDLIFQCSDSERTFRPSAFSIYTLLDGSARYAPLCSRLCSSASRSSSPTAYSCQLTPSTPGAALRFRKSKAVRSKIDCEMVEQGGELHLLVFLCCFPHARQTL